MNDEINDLNKNNSFIETIKKHKSLVITSFILLFLIIFSYFIYQEYKKNVIEDISDNFNKALILIQKNKNDQAYKILNDVINENNNFYSVSALNLIVEKDLIKDKNEILKKFDYVITKINLDKETKNLVIFKKILFIGEDIDESMLLDNLKPIIQSNSVWKSTVSNYIKKYYLSKKEYIKAKEFNSSK